MRYVLDASVVLCWVIARLHSSKAVQLRNEYQKQFHELIAPSIFPAEAASALTKSERQKVITVGQARVFLADILSTPPAMHPYDPLLFRATDISSSTRSSLNDCLYVALAEREGCELITADDKLVKNLQPTFPFIIALSSLP